MASHRLRLLRPVAQQHPGDAGTDRARIEAGRCQRGDLAADQSRIHQAVAESRQRRQRMQESRVGARSGDHGALQTLCEPSDGLRAVDAVRDQLGDHGIVERRDHGAGLHAGIDTQPIAFRNIEADDRTRRRHEAAGGVLRVEARLDGVPRHLDLPLAQRQLLAARNPQLPFDEVEPGDRLGHRMLHLQAGVHLDEVPGGRRPKRTALDQELDRAGALVAHGLGAGDGSLRDLGPQLRRHAGRGRLLDHLLVAPLQRAVALEQVHDVAVGVAEHLHLDVPGPDDHLLEQHAGIPERRFRLALRALQRRHEVRIASRPGACRARRRRRPP